MVDNKINLDLTPFVKVRLLFVMNKNDDENKNDDGDDLYEEFKNFSKK